MLIFYQSLSMMMWIAMRLIIFLQVAVVSDSARILGVFPTPSISHQIVFRPVMLELAKRGHEVVVITTDPIFPKDKTPTNFTEIDVHDMSYEMWAKFVEASSGKMKDFRFQMRIAMEQFLLIFKKQIVTKEVQNVLRDTRKYDLLIVEGCVRSALALTHVFKVPTIQFSSFGAVPGMYEVFGAPTHMSLYPLPLRQRIHNLTLWEKIYEYYNQYLIEKMINDNVEAENNVIKELFGPDVPPISELAKNVEMIFFNIYPLWDFNRPVPPNIIYLGGLHQNPPKLLPKELKSYLDPSTNGVIYTSLGTNVKPSSLPREKELKSYLDASTNGVIYMSLGTNVKPSSLPREKVRILLKVFASLPYNILWKWDQDELEGRPNNVKISKWFPQSDLLQHPNIKLFITQGGLQSTDEAITAGVPLVGIPMLGDQWYNTELYVLHKIGVKIDLETMTEDVLRNAIYTVLKDETCKNNIIQLRSKMHDQPLKPLDRAIWWIEHVLRHGGARHLRSPAAGISWAEYLELELVLVVVAVFVVLLLIIFALVKVVLRTLYRYSIDLKVKTH